MSPLIAELVLEPQIWTAEVVYAGFGSPMLRGGLVVVGEYVREVGPLEQLQASYPQATVLHQGRALSPPVVNAHTHLDLSSLPLYQGPYVGFIRHVIAGAEGRGAAAAEDGLKQLQALGVGAFGDIVARNEAMEFLLEHCPLPGVAYREVLGADPLQAEEHFKTLRPLLLGWKRREGGLKVGISPHTAHTVSAPLLQKLVEFARIEGFPLQIHLAESPEETVYFQSNSGPLAQFMQPFNPAWQALGISPVQYLADLGVLGPQLCLVHGVEVSEADVQILAQSGTKLVSCPRSNQNLGCRSLPWSLYLKHQVEIALGTDSLGSAPDLDVRAEAKSLWGQVDPRVLVRAATRSGYRVLGLNCPPITRGTPLSLVQSWGHWG